MAFEFLNEDEAEGRPFDGAPETRRGFKMRGPVDAVGRRPPPNREEGGRRFDLLWFRKEAMISFQGWLSGLAFVCWC